MTGKSPGRGAYSEPYRRRAACSGQGDSMEERGFDSNAEGGGGIWKARMEGRTQSKCEVYNFIPKIQKKVNSEDGLLLEPVKKWVQQDG